MVSHSRILNASWLDVCLSVGLEKFPNFDTRENESDRNVVVTSDWLLVSDAVDTSG